MRIQKLPRKYFAMGMLTNSRLLENGQSCFLNLFRMLEQRISPMRWNMNAYILPHSPKCLPTFPFRQYPWNVINSKLSFSRNEMFKKRTNAQQRTSIIDSSTHTVEYPGVHLLPSSHISCFDHFFAPCAASLKTFLPCLFLNLHKSFFWNSDIST